MDSLSNFADSVAIAGPFLLGAVVVIGAGVWLVKALIRAKADR